jgi:hypothetical protein
VVSTCWERRVGSPVYHAFGYDVETRERGRVAACTAVARLGVGEWFVWVGDEFPGDLCPLCAARVGVKEGV